MRKLLAPLLVLLGLTSSALTAQTPKALPYYIEWETVKGAGGYTIEVEDQTGLSVLSKQVTPDVSDIQLELPTGFYRFRIVTLNKFLRFENATDWVSFEVLSLSAPEFIGLSPRTVITDVPLSFVLQADRMSLSAKAFLVASDGKRTPLSIRKTKKDTFTLTGSALAKRGIYTLEISNSPSLITSTKNLVTVNYPEPIVKEVSPASIIERKKGVESPPPEIAIAGSGFSPEITVFLVPTEKKSSRTENGTNDSLKLKTVSKTHLVAIVPQDIESGTYMMQIANAPDLPAKGTLLFTVSESKEPVPAEPVKPEEPVQESTPEVQQAEEDASKEKTTPENLLIKRIALGGGANLDIITNNWNSIYDEPSFSGFVFTDVYLTDNLRPKTGVSRDYSIGARSEFSRLSNDGSGIYVESALLNVSFLLSPAITLSVPFMRFRAWIAGGLGYLSLESKTTAGESVSESSLDAVVEAGLVAEYPLGDRFAIGTGGQFSYTFNQEILKKFSITLCASVLFPIGK